MAALALLISAAREKGGAEGHRTWVIKWTSKVCVPIAWRSLM